MRLTNLGLLVVEDIAKNIRLFISCLIPLLSLGCRFRIFSVFVTRDRRILQQRLFLVQKKESFYLYHLGDD